MKKLDALLRLLPQPLFMVGLGLALLGVLFIDYLTGPRFPLTVGYLILVFAALKYVNIRFAYGFTLVMVASKTYIKHLFYLSEQSLWLDAYQFLSSSALYCLICYLLDAQMIKRKQVETELSELSNLNHSIISATDEGVVVFQADGQCILVNEAATKILGGTREQILQADFRKLKSWHTPESLLAAEETLKTGVAKKISAPIYTVFGKNVWCIISLARIDRKNAEPYLLTVFTDITAFKKAELEVRQAHQTAESALGRANAAERRIIGISEDTQRRIGQELHDDLGQHLTGIAFMSEVLAQRLSQQGVASAQDAAQMTALINEAIAKTRRMSQGLYPVELRESGLPAMLERFAHNVRSTYQIDCTFVQENDIDIDDQLTMINLYRITQEAVNNAIKHGAASEIIIALTASPSVMTLEISDNGCGIGARTGATEHDGLGMHSMQYRASLLGATFHIDTPLFGGTLVSIHLPIHQQAEFLHA